MFSSSVVILALANAAAVLAQASAGFDVLTSPPQGSSYKAGDVLPIVWTAGKSTGTVSLELIGGAAANALNPILSIACELCPASMTKLLSPQSRPRRSDVKSWRLWEGQKLTDM